MGPLRRIGIALLALLMLVGMCAPALEAVAAPAQTRPVQQGLAFREVLADAGPTTDLLPQADAAEPPLNVSREILLHGIDVTCVGLAGAPDDAPSDGPNVRLVFAGHQRSRLEAVTTAHVGDRIALVLNGVVLMAPVLQDPITGGEVVVYGGPGWDAQTLLGRIHSEGGVDLCQP